MLMKTNGLDKGPKTNKLVWISQREDTSRDQSIELANYINLNSRKT
ncbi:28660_t:CDS:1 [Racocetra persica]|uniref:28660_t:CDS:1 n=1 Tax=Racocetra persica TaxID=160502 RepID=A0ACA9NP04_9GLOM|nr:28660_t:CDS:1 [Racocetra persica]